MSWRTDGSRRFLKGRRRWVALALSLVAMSIGVVAIAVAENVGGFEIDASNINGALYSGTDSPPGNDWATGASQTGVFQLSTDGSPDVPGCYGSDIDRIQAAGASAFICDGSSDSVFNVTEPEQNIVSPSGKTPDDIWPVKPGNVRPKNDFSHAYTNGVFVDSPCDDDALDDDLQLRLAGHVGDNEGSHFWGFEFDRTPPDGFDDLKDNLGASFDLDFNRQQGDLLISFTVPGNANDPVVLDVFQVQNNPSQGQTAVFATAALNPNCTSNTDPDPDLAQGLTLLATNQANDVVAPPWKVPACDPTATNPQNGCRLVSGAPIPPPPPLGTDNRLPARDFAEANVDLTAFNIVNPCITSVLFTSRSSHPLEGADIQDVGGGDFELCGTKSGTKFHDRNADGTRDADGVDNIAGNADDESGIADWPIFLYPDTDGDGVLDAGEVDGRKQALTVADDPATPNVNETGQYKFENLGTGKFIACEAARSADGWFQSAPLAGTGVTDTCDNDTGNAERGYAFEMTGADHPGNDFGNYRKASKSGVKFEDLDADGAAREAGEPGLAGWTIYVDLDDDGVFDAGEPSAVTAADDPLTPNVDEAGSYTITGITPSSTVYKVREVLQSGWECSFPDPCFHEETFSSGDAVTGNDFGNFQNTSISGMKFKDADADGVKDLGEIGLGGWFIRLFAGTTLVGTEETAPDGTYSFTNVTPGDYVVCEDTTLKTGWVQSFPVSGSGDCTMLAVLPQTFGDEGHAVTTTSGQSFPNRDFGNTPLSTIDVSFTALADLPNGGDATHATEITCVDSADPANTVGTDADHDGDLTTDELKTSTSPVTCTITFVDP
jgi:hypothetical protein